MQPLHLKKILVQSFQTQNLFKLYCFCRFQFICVHVSSRSFSAAHLLFKISLVSFFKPYSRLVKQLLKLTDMNNKQPMSIALRQIFNFLFLMNRNFLSIFYQDNFIYLSSLLFLLKQIAFFGFRLFTFRFEIFLVFGISVILLFSNTVTVKG